MPCRFSDRFRSLRPFSGNIQAERTSLAPYALLALPTFYISIAWLYNSNAERTRQERREPGQRTTSRSKRMREPHNSEVNIASAGTATSTESKRLLILIELYLTETGSDGFLESRCEISSEFTVEGRKHKKNKTLVVNKKFEPPLLFMREFEEVRNDGFVIV